MKKTFLLITILSIILVGCGNLNLSIINKDKDKKVEDVYTGFQGLTMEFIKNAPPENVFHETEFPVVLSVWNKGTHNIDYEDADYEDSYEDAVMLLGVERDYNEIKSIDGISTGDAGDSVKCDGDNEKEEVRVNEEKPYNKIEFLLNGKTIVNPKGEQKIISYNVYAKKIEPQSETRQATLFATLCYPYKTELSASVCVDTDILGLRKSPKVCEVKDIDLAGGQGAPVAITKVETRILRQTDETTNEEKILPHFVIHVENKGSGEVFRRIGKDNDVNNVDKICSKCPLDPAAKDFNTLFVTARLGTKILDCNPKDEDSNKQDGDKGYIRLIGKKDTIRCQVNEKDADSENIGSYTSPLVVTLDYGYTSTISKSYTIERSTI